MAAIADQFDKRSDALVQYMCGPFDAPPDPASPHSLAVV
jgi:hypothetical protein